jgi:hypothetical protein
MYFPAPCRYAIRESTCEFEAPRCRTSLFNLTVLFRKGEETRLNALTLPKGERAFRAFSPQAAFSRRFRDFYNRSDALNSLLKLTWDKAGAHMSSATSRRFIPCSTSPYRL